MKILLTGATGFVGSHVLDCLRSRGLAVRVLVRKTSDWRFIKPHAAHVDCCAGSVDDVESLRTALRGVTHVIHCAGATSARHTADYYRINCNGTRNVVAAVNECQTDVQRLLHLSSLAAAHPATADAPAREDDAPAPVSEYGKSKLAAEQEIRKHCQVPFTILRPPSVYGPRDYAFRTLFAAVRWHIRPLLGGGRQTLSIIYVKDLADATVTSLMHPAAKGRTYFATAPEVVTVRRLVTEIARQMEVWTVPLRLPLPALWPICVLEETTSKLTGKPSLLNRQKYAELTASGWVCDATRLGNETGFQASTSLADGIRQTAEWYRENRWL